MLYICLVFLFTFLSCSSPNDGKRSSLKSKDSSTHIIHTDQVGQHDTLGAKIIDTFPIYANLRVSPYSMDSIIAYVTFVNKSNNNVWLYKPILPNSFPSEDAFSIYDRKLSKLPFLGRIDSNNYYSKPGDLIRLIKPDLSKDNLEKFNAGDSIQFSINLAKIYDFNILKKKGEDSFLVEYANLFPYIENERHVFKLNTDLNVDQPVYFVITSVKKMSEAFRLSIRLPSN